MWSNSGLPSEKQFAECFLSDSADKQGTNDPGIHRETGLVWIGIDESHVNLQLQSVTTFLEILELVAFFTVHVTTFLVDTSWWVEFQPLLKQYAQVKNGFNIFPQRSVLTKKNTPKPHPSQARLLERDIIGAATSPICFWRCNDQNSRACEGPKAPGLIYDTNVDASRIPLRSTSKNGSKVFFFAHQTLVANAWLLPSQGTNISHLWKRNIIFKSDFFWGIC